MRKNNGKKKTTKKETGKFQQKNPWMESHVDNFKSQLGQDQYIYQAFFQDKQNGVFVEVGAHDGNNLSNTLFFEKEMNWSGVCVEPGRISSRIKLSRSNSQVFNCCACPLEFENQIVRFREHATSEISTTIFQDLYEPPHYAKSLEMEEGVYWDRLKRCKTLDSIFNEAKLEKDIDYVSIDTQGSEWLVIKDLPFDKWNVKVFTIAHDMFQGGEKEKNRNQIKLLMESNGYTLETWFGLDHLNKDSWDHAISEGIIEDLYVKQDA